MSAYAWFALFVIAVCVAGVLFSLPELLAAVRARYARQEYDAAQASGDLNRLQRMLDAQRLHAADQQRIIAGLEGDLRAERAARRIERWAHGQEVQSITEAPSFAPIADLLAANEAARTDWPEPERWA